MSSYLVMSASVVAPFSFSKLINEFWLTGGYFTNIFRKVSTAGHLLGIRLLCDEFNTGKHTVEEFHRQFCDLVGQPEMSLEEFTQKWNSSVDLSKLGRIKQLKTKLAEHGVELVIVGNTNVLHATAIREADAAGDKQLNPDNFKPSYLDPSLISGSHITLAVTSELARDDHKVIIGTTPTPQWGLFSWINPAAWLGYYAGQARQRVVQGLQREFPGLVNELAVNVDDAFPANFPVKILDRLSGRAAAQAQALLDKFDAAKSPSLTSAADMPANAGECRSHSTSPDLSKSFVVVNRDDAERSDTKQNLTA